MICSSDGTFQHVRREVFPLQLGLAPALEMLIEEFRERTGIETRLAASIDLLPQNTSEWSVSVYRIFQEALTNVARHAGATRVDACLTVEDGFLDLEIRDNGAGFDPAAASSKSCGILGMKERAARLGGHLRFLRLEPNGTCVQARFPFPPL